MSAVPSHDFETRQFPVLTRSLPAMWHTRRKRSSGRYREKEKGEVHARCRRRKCNAMMTSPSRLPFVVAAVLVRPAFPFANSHLDVGAPIVAHLPTEPHRTFTAYATSHRTTVSYPSPSPPPRPRHGNSEIHEREPDLPQAVLVSGIDYQTPPRRNSASNYIETKARRFSPFLENGRSSEK